MPYSASAAPSSSLKKRRAAKAMRATCTSLLVECELLVRTTNPCETAPLEESATCDQ
jgi:hypothetical protein